MSHTEHHQEIIIAAEHHGQRLDVVLALLIPQYSRSLLSNCIKKGFVSINGNPAKPKDKLKCNDIIQFSISLESLEFDSETSKPQDIPIDIVYEDEFLVVINKQVGLVVHPGAGNPDHTLVNALLHYCPALEHLPRAGIVHRLDKDTTGLLIVGKTTTAYTQLTRLMQERNIHRHYLTLVHGNVLQSGEIDTYFGRHSRNRLKMAVTASGRQAVTHYSINKHFEGFTLLDVQLLTGRTHQIRVHMAHINHPVVGDPLYGRNARLPKDASDELKSALLGFKRQALHAAELEFAHPITHQRLTCHAALPDDFKQLLNLLAMHHEKNYP